MSAASARATDCGWSSASRCAKARRGRAADGERSKRMGEHGTAGRHSARAVGGGSALAARGGIAADAPGHQHHRMAKPAVRPCAHRIVCDGRATQKPVARTPAQAQPHAIVLEVLGGKVLEHPRGPPAGHDERDAAAVSAMRPAPAQTALSQKAQASTAVNGAPVEQARTGRSPRGSAVTASRCAQSKHGEQTSHAQKRRMRLPGASSAAPAAS